MPWLNPRILDAAGVISLHQAVLGNPFPLNKKILDDVYPGINISPPTLGYSRRTAKERLTPRYVSAKPPVLGQDLNDQRYVLVPAAPIRKTAYPGYLLDSLLF